MDSDTLERGGLLRTLCPHARVQEGGLRAANPSGKRRGGPHDPPREHSSRIPEPAPLLAREVLGCYVFGVMGREIPQGASWETPDGPKLGKGANRPCHPTSAPLNLHGSDSATMAPGVPQHPHMCNHRDNYVSLNIFPAHPRPIGTPQYFFYFSFFLFFCLFLFSCKTNSLSCHKITSGNTTSLQKVTNATNSQKHAPTGSGSPVLAPGGGGEGGLLPGRGESPLRQRKQTSPWGEGPLGTWLAMKPAQRVGGTAERPEASLTPHLEAFAT